MESKQLEPLTTRLKTVIRGIPVDIITQGGAVKASVANPFAFGRINLDLFNPQDKPPSGDTIRQMLEEAIGRMGLEPDRQVILPTEKNNVCVFS